MDELADLIQDAHVCHKFNIDTPPTGLRVLLRELNVFEFWCRHTSRIADKAHAEDVQSKVDWFWTWHTSCIDTLEIPPLLFSPQLDHRSIAAFVVALSKPEFACNIFFSIFEDQDACVVNFDRTMNFLISQIWSRVALIGCWWD